MPAQIAKAALRRLVVAKLEPTPENYSQAYQQEAGIPAAAAPAAPAIERSAEPSGEQWAELIDRIVRGVERRSRQWTSARKKDSLQRVLGGSRGDAGRLQQRLKQLVASWDSDTPGGEGSDAPIETMPAELQSETASTPAPAAEVVETIAIAADGAVDGAPSSA
ncbi:MAG TPA: GGDEF domain-containing protein, partial [Albitalea sp.]|nr:GGDEF domain-containing protein [Albitalea sp.]